MNVKTMTAAAAVFAAVVLGIGAGASPCAAGSGKLFPRLSAFFQASGQTGAAVTRSGRDAMPPPPPHRHGPPLMRCISRLDISADTQSAIDELVQARQEEKKSAFEARKAQMDAYIAALTASPIDDEALAAAQDALIAGRQADMQSDFALDEAIVALLTDEELAELAACMTEAGPPAGSPPAE